MGDLYMGTITFDTLKFANRLKAAGVPPAQAEAEAEALSEVFETQSSDLVTKTDLKVYESALRSDMEKLEFALRSDMEKLESGIRSDMEKLESGIRSDMGKLEFGLRRDMELGFAKADGKFALLQWMMGILLAGVISLVLKAFF